MDKNYYTILFFCFIHLCINYSFAQSDKNTYTKYLDSADTTYDEFPKMATLYLDSIPNPVADNIKGHLAKYYHLRVLISDRLNNTAELFQNSIMALKYAKIEKKYDIAGIVSIELFYNKYYIQNDSTAFRYPVFIFSK